jgi:hypothetical protein
VRRDCLALGGFFGAVNAARSVVSTEREPANARWQPVSFEYAKNSASVADDMVGDDSADMMNTALVVT